MPRSSHARVAAAPPKEVRPAAAPQWLRWTVLALAAALLVFYFCGDVSDTDTWWHLKTGQYIVQQHKLPVPDPFAYTTYMWKPAYAGEEVTRYFNLTHEWLAQAFLYSIYAAGGFAAMVFVRALCMASFCGLAGLIVWRRTHGFYRAIGAALAVTLVARTFTGDRPQYLTYLFLALAILILESRRRLWILPPLLLVWANCHAGFFLGWVVMGAYCGEALIQRLRGTPPVDEKRLWVFSLAAVLVSGLNPNYFRLLEVMRYYRQSAIQSQIWEWQYPKYWEITPFTVLVYGALAVMLLNRRRTRISDWILLAAFGAAGFLALRNIILAGFVGSILIASYLPRSREEAGGRGWLAAGLVALGGTIAIYPGATAAALGALVAIVAVFWHGKWRLAAEAGLAVFLAAAIAMLFVHGDVQPRATTWRVPEKAADFLVEHHIRGRIFNTYGQGGYLIWRLWPQLQVFIDGRALNEKVFQDAARIGMNAADTGGPSGEQLLRTYGIDVIVMDSFEPVSGQAYFLPAALADPAQKEWKLVYQDVHDTIYMRNPPPDVPVLNSLDALSNMEQQCAFLVDHEAPKCAGGMYDIFHRIGDEKRALQWANVYNTRGGRTNYFEKRR